MACRVLIVEDDDAFAEILGMVITGDERFELVGRAANGAEGIALAAALDPDVVTMDIDLPRIDGVEATRELVAHRPDRRIVVVSGSPFRERIEAAKAAGAAAFVNKVHVVDALRDVLLAACRGERFVVV